MNVLDVCLQLINYLSWVEKMNVNSDWTQEC